jgi:phosphoglucosamine mutase
MTRKYFGTDGIRGRVGTPPITADFAVRLGRAAGVVLGGGGSAPRVLIGKDPRSSGYMLEAALEAGLSAAGARAVLTGPLPTPAIAYLTRTQGAQAGIVISASHNSYADNGIKFFSATGEKISDAMELAIEAEVDRPFVTVAPELLGKAERLEDARGRYVEFCKSTLKSPITRLQPMRIVVDAANGAGFKVAPAVFQELGFEVVAIGCEPNGLNINKGCGATDLSALKQKVQETRADLGIALDGDGDRLMMLDKNGAVIDGDDILFVLASHWQASGRLRGPVVGTVMTNFGIESAFEKRGIAFARAQVGDRYVLELLKAQGGTLGGEASGHVLCLDRATTGDALVSALQVLEVLAETGQSFAQLLSGVTRVPQVMINVRLAPGSKPLQTAAVQDALAQAEQALVGSGRVVLRASGTEPLVRVTVEGVDQTQVQYHAEKLAEVVRQAAAFPALK